MTQLATTEFPLGIIKSPTKYEEITALGELLTNVASTVALGGGVLLFLYLVFGGFRYLTAGGDEKAVDAAKKIMTNAIIGLLIIVSAYFVTDILGTILGFGNIFNLVFPSP